MLILDARHQIHVVLTSDDEDALAAVTLGVRVLQDIEQVASLDVEDDFFEPDAARRRRRLGPLGYSWLPNLVSPGRTRSTRDTGD